MTRYTNSGIKRTYVEAGFDNDEPSTSQAPMQKKAPSNPSPTTTSVPAPIIETNEASGSQPTADPSAPQPRQHRRRHRSKKGKGLPPPVKKMKTAAVPGSNEPTQKQEACQGTGANAVAVKSSTSGERPKKKMRIRQPKDGLPRDGRQRELDAREARRLKRIEERNAATTCFACRERGHAARDCPKASEIAETEDGPARIVGICYRCGSQKHTLSKCKKAADPGNPLPFASCFVCSGKGHLAGSCPQNQDRGVYPNGGSCKICGDTAHLAKECTVRKNEMAAKAAVGTGHGAGADEDDFMVLKRRAKEVEKEEHLEGRLKHVLEASEKSTARISSKVAAPVKKKVVVF